MTAGLVHAACGHAAAMATLRRGLGLDPETGLVMPRTQGRILDAISGLPARVSMGVGLSSVVAVIRGAHPGGRVLLRAELDAATGAAPVPGASAVHAAALVGAAFVLAERRDELCGDVVLAWQPGSAGCGGAARMLNEGLLDAAGRRVDAAYAVRTLPGLPRGVVAIRPGPMLTAADQIHIDLRDTRGGGARPVSVACQLAAALDRAQFGDGGGLAVEQILAGDELATVTATLRCHHPAGQTRAYETARRLATGYATAHGMRATVRLTATQPVTVNHPAEVAWVHRTVTEMYGRERLVELSHPVTASDDFGAVLDVVPGALALLLGAIPDPDPGSDITLLPTAAALLAGLAIRRLAARRVTPATIHARVAHHPVQAVAPVSRAQRGVGAAPPLAPRPHRGGQHQPSSHTSGAATRTPRGAPGPEDAPGAGLTGVPGTRHHQDQDQEGDWRWAG